MEYTYSVANDTLNGIVAGTMLLAELQADVDIKAITEVLSLSVVADVITVTITTGMGGNKPLMDIVVNNHDGIPLPQEPVKMTSDGILITQTHPETVGFEMCDRDIKIVTCTVSEADSLEDLKYNPSTNLEVPWGEMTLVGVFKADGVACIDQDEADASGVKSVWDYRAQHQT